MRPPTSRFTTRDPALVAAVVGALSTTAVLIGPALRPGYALYLDHIAVPEPARPQWQHLTTPEGLRAWPLSGVSWAWSQILPSWGFQHLTLLSAVVGAGLGVGVVLRQWGWGAALAGSIMAIANPYVVERLLLGQAGLLLAYAALPWILVASRQQTAGLRVGLVSLASVPAALTPWGALVAGTAAVGVGIGRRRRPGEILAQAGASVALCLPWLIPALRMPPSPADPNGAYAFRLADDTSLGTFVSALTGGGVWSSSAQLGARTGGVGVAITVAAVTLGVIGAWAVLRAQRREGVLLALTWVGLPAATAVLSGPALGIWADLQSAPAVALFRDLHRALAPSTMAFVLLAAIGVRVLVSAVSFGQAGSRAVLGVLLPTSLAVMLVPGSPARLHSAYDPSPFSPEWSGVVAAVEVPGRVVSLPWQPLRRADWMTQTFLDPTVKALGERTVADTTLTVVRDGESITVHDAAPDQGVDDALASRLTAGTGDPVPSDLLTSSGITHVLIWKNSPGVVPRRSAGWDVTFSGADFELWSVEDAATR